MPANYLPGAVQIPSREDAAYLNSVQGSSLKRHVERYFRCKLLLMPEHNQVLVYGLSPKYAKDAADYLAAQVGPKRVESEKALSRSQGSASGPGAQGAQSGERRQGAEERSPGRGRRGAPAAGRAAMQRPRMKGPLPVNPDDLTS